jgi:hypothetical protein
MRLWVRSALFLALFNCLRPLAVSAEPLPPPQITRALSKNLQFEAESDPQTGETIVYTHNRDPQGGWARGEKLWKFRRWFRSFSLSNDGSALVAGPNDLNLLPAENARDDYVLLSFIITGKLIREITLKQLLGSPSKLRPTSDGLLWGHVYFEGMDPNDLVFVDTVVGFFIFDSHTAKCLFPPKNAIDPPAR